MLQYVAEISNLIPLRKKKGTLKKYTPGWRGCFKLHLKRKAKSIDHFGQLHHFPQVRNTPTPSKPGGFSFGLPFKGACPHTTGIHQVDGLVSFEGYFKRHLRASFRDSHLELLLGKTRSLDWSQTEICAINAKLTYNDT